MICSATDFLPAFINTLTNLDGKMLLLFDNCGCHKVDVVEKQMSDMGIHVALLPPNMTAIIQVLDLVVNGPLKAHIRHLRAMVIVESFKVFKAKYCDEQTKPPKQRLEMKFKQENQTCMRVWQTS